MKLFLAAILLATPSLALAGPAPAARHAKPHATHPPKAEGTKKSGESQPAKEFFHPSEVRTTGPVTVGGQPVPYDAVAGTLVVHPKDWSDTDALDADQDAADKNKGPKPEASMFYTAYFKQGA